MHGFVRYFQRLLEGWVRFTTH